MYEHISAICLQVTVAFAEKFAGEEVSGDMLFPRSLATTGICTYSRKSSALYLAVRIQNGTHQRNLFAGYSCTLFKNVL
jgi:hypothetical protein